MAKDYLALVRGLVDLGWQVLLLCPVDLSHTGEAEVALLGRMTLTLKIQTALRVGLAYCLVISFLYLFSFLKGIKRHKKARN